MNSSVRGFTIVELLIVVVVIAILAAITIVSYNGITEQARIGGAKNFASQIKHRDLADAQGYWDFNECSGSTVGNSAGVSSSATLVSGTIAWSTDTPSGSGCSFSFNGSTFINTGVILKNSYYMKSAWIKTSSASTQNIVSDIGTNPNSAFYLSSGGRPNAGHNNNWNYVQATDAVNDGKWHHVGVEYTQNGSSSTGTMILTVDGKVAATHTSVPTMSVVATSTQLIGVYNSGNYFNGLMDDVIIIAK